MKNEILKRLLSSSILLPVSFFLILKGSLYFIIFLSICLIISLLEWFNLSRTIYFKIIGTIFLFCSFLSAYAIRNLYKDDINIGLYFFLLIFLISISSDIGGYTFGKIFKGPKLTKISPNKTYSGALGGFIFTWITIYLYSYFNIYFSFSLKIIVYSLILSGINQIGDLIISFFKRKSNIKNTGSIIPGHGGILDRIDGMIFVFPFAYITLDLIKN